MSVASSQKLTIACLFLLFVFHVYKEQNSINLIHQELEQLKSSVCVGGGREKLLLYSVLG